MNLRKKIETKVRNQQLIFDINIFIYLSFDSRNSSDKLKTSFQTTDLTLQIIGLPR